MGKIITKLEMKQGTNDAFFIYRNGKLLLGGHDKSIIEKVLMFLQNEGKCNHTNSERIGETKLWCCNICGQRIEDF